MKYEKEHITESIAEILLRRKIDINKPINIKVSHIDYEGHFDTFHISSVMNLPDANYQGLYRPAVIGFKEVFESDKPFSKSTFYPQFVFITDEGYIDIELNNEIENNK